MNKKWTLVIGLSRRSAKFREIKEKPVRAFLLFRLRSPSVARPRPGADLNVAHAVRSIDSSFRVHLSNWSALADRSNGQSARMKFYSRRVLLSAKIA